MCMSILDKILTFIVCTSLMFIPTGCVKTGNTNNGSQVELTDGVKEEENTTFEEGEKVMVTITMEDGGVMKLELYPNQAPITVENFVNLAKEGFYDGLTFHRIVKGFMIQGGDPEGTGMGGSKKNIKGEFIVNGINNTISHKRGVISMARARDYNSASSQFFIVHEDAAFLDGDYAAFGKLVEGYDVLDSLANTKVSGETPITKPVIKSITVE